MDHNESSLKDKEPDYSRVFEKNPVKFTYAFKTLKNKGNLVYEYNPFRNYRLSKTMYEYQNSVYSYEELNSLFNIKLYIKNKEGEYEESENAEKDLLDTDNPIIWRQGKIDLNASESPIIKRAGELVDFETKELSFSLNHPIDILPQYSYDGSANLIINDGLNQPKLINSRFSPTERNQYQIVDRKGDNDTNIYDQGDEFDIDTSLHKKTKLIPNILFRGTFSSGNLSIGNYHFYFRYMDADGNESDFIAESGLVSIFIGNTPYNIHTGVRNENSYKGVSFLLTNLDSGYQYLSVYYTKATADVLENSSVSAFKIEQKYLINTANVCQLKITGFEETTEIPLTDINLQYQIFNNVETQALCQNRVFFGNITEQDIDYKELQDISLRFLPFYTEKEYNVDEKISETYEPKSDYSNSYYDSNYIYNNTGYWPEEIYRFGIVYIMNDGTLTPVFNVRGSKELKKWGGTNPYSSIPYKQDNSRIYITYNEETNIINSYGKESQVQDMLENCKGVVKFPTASNNQILGIIFKLVEDKDEIKEKLKELGVRGYFFVRQKRIPTTLCQALTIGLDESSHTPIIPYSNDSKTIYVAECFLGKDKPSLTHNYDARCNRVSRPSSLGVTAICPEYDIDYPYYNNLFSGDTFTIGKIGKVDLKQQSWNHRYYYSQTDSSSSSDTTNPQQPRINKEQVQIQAVEDNVKLTAIDDLFFSARAGEMEEVRKFEFLESENKDSNNKRLLRGSYGPFLGIKGCTFQSSLINIYIPGYNNSNISDYFLIRYNDKTPFYAIGDRYSIDTIDNSKEYYRGDCYICQFTHRLNRNFQDSNAPTNDSIVDPKCWDNNFKYTDGVLKKEDLDKINLGDVNAIQLGQWITFTLRSTKNLNIRTIDSSNVDESALVGHSRGYYPYLPLSAKGIYKIPEALCYNKGFEKSVSERYNFEIPDIPAKKNDFSNRIAYSDIIITDAFQNGARVFGGQNYRDYPKTYGSITKLIELGGNLLCIFEHGIALIPVNERTVAGESSGGTVYINTQNVLPENPKIISDTFGSQWKESIVKTPYGIYGVDTVGKKIWRTNGEDFDCISDLHIQEFLNSNITLTERELSPIIGIRNVKTHYNKFKKDVMFTFYDNLHGFQEKAWNICFNEAIGKWVTFYSWIPSYSENIYNQYFSFDRNTSKWIAKLGMSNADNDFSDGIVLSNNIINDDYFKAKVSFKDGILEKLFGDDYEIRYSLERDNYKNNKLFDLQPPVEGVAYLKLAKNTTYNQLRSELYVREYTEGETTYLLDDPGNKKKYTARVKGGNTEEETLPNGQSQYDIWSRNDNLKIYKDDRGRRVNLENEKIINSNIVYLLNIKATVSMPNKSSSLQESLANRQQIDSGYFESVIAVIPKYNMQFLTTDFWKHGQAGIIDITDKILPTYWYGKQHPFEFEFVVATSPDSHKIFDNLEIISNKAAPESFHYEIVGDCYDFAKDKKNMYIRQEATKELYQFNGSDIVFNPDYKDLISEHRPLSPGDPDPKHYDKSTIFPLYYYRQDTINEIEDFYHLHGHKDKYGKGDKNFSALAGAEIVRYENLDEYRIWNHAKAVDIKENGLLRGNMYYKEDKWDVQINPINLVQKNETKGEWDNIYRRDSEAQQYIVPAECNLFPPPAAIYNRDDKTKEITLPEDWTRNIISWPDYQKRNQEAKLKDKFVKIRIRYSGEDLAIISAIRTLYSISYA